MGIVTRKTYYKDGDFFLDYELIGEEVVVHCEIFNVKPSVLKRMFSIFNSFCEECKGSNVNTIIGAPRSPKLARIFNGEYIGMVNEYEVFKWDLKQLS